MRHPGKTPPVRGPHGEPLPGSIAEIHYLKLGGIPQWVLIRGQSLANPPLILLHGGPGLSETRLFRYFNDTLEQYFTVVYWDQRGAGKSYDRAIPRASMTTAQFVADLGELVEAVCHRLGHRKVVLYGHSWGSVIGVLHAAAHPDTVAAYVGSGQVGDWAAGERTSYRTAIADAQRLGNLRVLKKLRAIGPPPHDPKRLWTQRTCLQRLDGTYDARTMWQFARILLGGKEYSLVDLPRFWRGFRWSIDVMWSEVSKLNLHELAPALDVPVFFFLGRNDRWVPPEVSVAYFDALTAPDKKLLFFEHSGHEPFMDEAAAFNAAMIEMVRPVALDTSSIVHGELEIHPAETPPPAAAAPDQPRRS